MNFTLGYNTLRFIAILWPFVDKFHAYRSASEKALLNFTFKLDSSIMPVDCKKIVTKWGSLLCTWANPMDSF